MLTAAELKIVVSTLSKRRAWVRKTLDGGGLEPELKNEHAETLKLLESAIQKLSATSPNKPIFTSAKKEVWHPNTINEARVLVAEDNEDSAQLLIGMLTDMGVKHVDHAKDGIEAFDSIKRADAPYHIILCDWDMPEINGIQVHSKAKASNTLGNAHFIMVTAVTEAPRIKQAVQQGINDYVVKPIDIDLLENKIFAALGLEKPQSN